MADGEKLQEFPDVSNKLAAPKKLSAFEKDRQAAEAKRLRAEEENAAALRAFEDSFGHEEGDDFPPSVPRKGLPSGPRAAGPGPERPATISGASKAWSSSIGPGSGMPPPNLKRKRALDEMREAQEARREQSMHGNQDSQGQGRYESHSTSHEDVREDEAPRPTVHLSQLPPSISEGHVKALLAGHVDVHSVQFLPPARPGTAGKRSLSAIVALAIETTTAQIDTAVTVLKDKYLGCGFHLVISRHLSSSALHPSMMNASTASSQEPFAAERPKEPPRPSLRNAPPPMEQRGFAPPGPYDGSHRGGYNSSQQPEALINVHAPVDIATLRAIHILVERLTTEPDSERALQLEALLMSMPDVQRDERFAFLYDSRSAAGVYYRYLLWGPSSRPDQEQHAQGLERVYDDMIFDWAPPHGETPFLDLSELADVVTDMDYASSEEESDDEGGGRRFNSRTHDGPAMEQNEKAHLGPLKHARLIHFLSRLPTTNARLRKGDVARVTNFAINHAGQGAEEIVDLLLLNIERPLCYSLAAKYELESEPSEEEGSDDYEPEAELPSLGLGSGTNSPHPPPQATKKETDDPSAAKLIALYLVSDILSASSTAGARNAWKYRQLFEAGFKTLHTFENLGRLEKELKWGRLKAEQWKRRVGAVFSIWETWSVFSGDVQETLKKCFFEPPLSEEELRVEREKEAEEKIKVEEKKEVVFKRVGKGVSPVPAVVPPAIQAENRQVKADNDDVDGAPIEDLDGTPLNEEIDGAPMEEMDGAPMELDIAPAQEQVPSSDSGQTQKVSMQLATNNGSNGGVPKPSGPKRRMRAEDMFASDEE
ncbi:hypothetical protein LTR62_000654 [Meristemomyces frigidus]|uniref:CID domain-containing protein n=1 Tax=Meristemomyces frigidus TaxID=1508187 RepID=A0AAN7THI7_9PEZI|nr:hypothetical protein LTR62_000654 [Meristemomyces frigidus]